MAPHILRMKHVVIAAPLRQTVLVTGFGAFPGARRNPTLEILRQLERRRGALARLGIDLRCATLPVVYAAVGPALDAAVRGHRPDAILHLGLAGRRRHIGVETRAVNRAGPLHRDAARALPCQILVPGAKPVLAATYPAARIAATLRRAGHDAKLSIDAGDYVCNATLFHTLRGALAPNVGFIHVPKASQAMRRGRGRPGIEDLTRAVALAVREMARARAAARPIPIRHIEVEGALR